jgi:hypothetical protein
MATNEVVLPFATIRTRILRTLIPAFDLPITHALATPFPTKRWQRPAYAFFARPVVIRTDDTLEVGPPERWAVVEAATGQLLLYAHWELLPFAPEANWPAVTLARQPPQSMPEPAAPDVSITALEELMDTLAPSFFAGEAGNPALRATLADYARQLIGAPFVEQQRALTPDFFDWLLR